MALRRCLERCGALINAGSYCRRCKPRNGSTRQWRSLRDQILARDRWTCQRCGVDAGGSDHPSNLQALCTDCNLAKGTS